MSSWRWNRYNANIAKTQPAKVTDSTIPARLDAVINNPSVGTSDKTFCESLKAGWQKYNSLTAGQYAAFEKCEARYSPQNAANMAQEQQKRNDWIANFDNEKRAILNICAQYYSKTVYFKDIADKVLADPKFTPSEKQYNAMCGNKYAQRLIENVRSPSKFEVGSMVSLRDTYYRNAYNWMKKEDIPYVILAISDASSPTRGSRICTLLPIGEIDKIEVEEKHLKKYHEKESDSQPRNKNDEEVSF